MTRAWNQASVRQMKPEYLVMGIQRWLPDATNFTAGVVEIQRVVCRDITKTRRNILQFFTAVKTITLRIKISDIFLIFAQNIVHGYTLEPPQLGSSNMYYLPKTYVLESK